MSPARVGALAVLALVALDLAAMPAVLPSTRIDLGSSTSGLLWIQCSYLLGLALPLLLLGPPASALDPRLTTVAGLAAVAIGALLAASADSTGAVVVGRALQGAGTAALIVPAVAAMHPVGRRPLIVVAALVVLAVAPFVGGVLAEKASWRWLFRLELAPAALAALLLLAPRERVPSSDVRRPAALAAGVLLATICLIQAGPWGWASADTLLLLAAGAALLAVAWGDRPRGAAPVIVGGLAAILLFGPQYFELVRGLSPLRSGLLSVAVTGSAAVLAVLVALVTPRVGSRALLATGLATAAVGAVGATRIDPASSYAVIVASLALLGAGAGAAAGALAAAGGMARAGAATAAGVALVLAAAGAVFERAQLDERDSGGSFEDAVSAGLVGSAWLVATLLAVAAILAWRQRSQ